MARSPGSRKRGAVELGTIYNVSLDPTKGKEQQGQRYVLVVSTADFNQINGMPIIAPITSGGDFARYAGFTVPLTGAGTKTTGVVLCNQIRVLDLNERQAQKIETVPDFIIQDVLDKIITIFDTGEQ